MKKVLFSLSVFAVVLFAAQSCTKNSSIESPSIEQSDLSSADDFSETEEFMTEIQEDPIGYEPEAITATLTFPSGTAATATEDQSGVGCSTYKYVDANKVGSGSRGITISLLTSGVRSIQSITNTNTKTGTTAANTLVFSDKTDGVDSNHYTVKLAASSDTFRNGSAKMTITYTDGKGVTGKIKNITVKCVGLDAGSNVFGTQKWGLLKEGVSGTNLAAAGSSITNATLKTASVAYVQGWIPVVGDVIKYGSNYQGKIILATMSKDTVTKTGVFYGKKWKVGVVQWNAAGTCKSSRTTKNITLYENEFTTKLFSKDGTTAATKFVH